MAAPAVVSFSCMKTRIVFLMLIVLCFLAACSKPPAPELVLEPTPLISGGIGWGVVNLAWVRLKSEASYAAMDSSFVRRLDVLELIARASKPDGQDKGVWYRVQLEGEEGWIHESALNVYESREQAEFQVRNGRLDG